MREKAAFAGKLAEERKAACDRWYAEGGELFLDWIAENYRIHTGEPLDVSEKYYRQLAILVGNPWLEKITVIKAAQRGYTELLIAAMAFSLAFLKIPTAFGMETDTKKKETVGTRVQPAFAYSPALSQAGVELKQKTKREDINNKSSISVGGTPLTIFHANTSKTANQGDRQAAGNISSFTSFFNLEDEIELWPSQILDIMEKRMANSDLPTKPERAGSTPGAEGGLVDTRVKSADHIFQWQVTCPHCYQEQFVDPFDNFLRPREIELDNGVREMAYLDPFVKPLHWYYHDEDDKINTAYIGCVACDLELDKDTLANGDFVCKITNELAMTISDRALRERKKIANVGIQMPQLASRKFSPTDSLQGFMKMNRIESLVDHVQQGLGKAFSPIGGKINLNKLKACSGLALPFKRSDRKPDLVIMGVDQGRPNWGIACEVYLPDGETDKSILYKDARLNCIWYGSIVEQDIVDKAIALGVDVIGIDNEPEYNAFADLAEKHLPQGPSINTLTRERTKTKAQIYLMDQLQLKDQEFKRTVRSRQNSTKRQERESKIIIYNIDRTTWLDAAKQRIYRELIHFPPGLEYDPKDDKNLFRHYMTNDRIEGKWTDAKPDHYFHAHSFMEAVLLASFSEPGAKGQPIRVISGTL